jgi:hypothetical protein
MVGRMSHEYLFPVGLPVPAAGLGLETDVLRRVAVALDVPFDAEPGLYLAPAVGCGDLSVHAVVADADARAASVRSVGFEVDVTLALTDLGHSSSDRMMRTFRDVLRVVLAFAGVAGMRALLLEEVTDDSLILRIDDGDLTLNDLWPGWLVWPEVLCAIPEPHRYASLTLSR